MKKAIIAEKFNAEKIAALFFEISEERYPVAEKILQVCNEYTKKAKADEYEKIYLNISLLNAIRNMIREVSPTRLYRSIQHRDDLYKAIIEALELLEDSLDEFEDENLDE